MTLHRTPRQTLAALSATCLCVAGLLVAAPAGAGTTALEAETFTSTSGHSVVRVDATASGGKQRTFWRNGSTRGSFTAPGVVTGIRVTARGDGCGGAPVLQVSVDGKHVASHLVTSNRWSSYAVAGTWPAGGHALDVSFTNDRRTSACDRNLYVDVVHVTTEAAATSTNPFVGTQGYVEPVSSARTAADARRAWDPAGAAALDRIAAGPQALWLGDWVPTTSLAGEVDTRVSAAAAAGALPVLVAYAIPGRDCGGYSAGGLGSPSAYATWVDQLARGIGDRAAVVVLEPDALGGLGCLDDVHRAERLAMLSDAVARLTVNPRTSVYIDAGNSAWRPVEEMVAALRASGVDRARGFALNVSNFFDTPTSVGYGEKISAALGGAGFVVDTSRNGLGSNGEWCNPDGRALGTPWSTVTGSASADALLWIKRPGESDGTCNGGPPAGQFWVDHAIGLGLRATTP